MTEQWWVFIFGSGQEHEGKFVRAFGEYSQARQKMCDKYGRKWAFQYSELEWEEWERRARLQGYPVETLLEEIK